MPFLHSLFPCFGGGGDEEQHPDSHDRPAKLNEGTPRTSSQEHDYKAPLPISQAPGSHQAPLYRPDTDKKLPPQPGTSASNAFELPGSSPDLHEMPATHLPATHPLAARRASTATSSSQAQPRPSQQSEQQPLSPHSPHSAHFTHPASTPATSTYQPSEQGDPDAISPVPTATSAATSPYGYAPRGANANMYSNVADALTDRKRMFERLRKANGVDPQQQQQVVNGGFAGVNHGSFSVAPVEMEAPMQYQQPQQQQQQQQQQVPVEIGSREHVRNPSGPKELE